MKQPTYSTSQIAALIGVHPNTVRFYEAQGLLPCVPRRANGYRRYSGRHVLALRLVRAAFRAEILNGNLRNQAVDIVKSSAAGYAKQAAEKTHDYKQHLEQEIERAKQAVVLTQHMLCKEAPDAEEAASLSRKQVASQIGVSADVLRDWERNGLITPSKNRNQMQYTTAAVNRASVVFILRNAGYSQMSIRRMLQRADQGEADLRKAVDTPDEHEDIISVTDRYITSLQGALQDVEEMFEILRKIK